MTLFSPGGLELSDHRYRQSATAIIPVFVSMPCAPSFGIPQNWVARGGGASCAVWGLDAVVIIYLRVEFARDDDAEDRIGHADFKNPIARLPELPPDATVLVCAFGSDRAPMFI